MFVHDDSKDQALEYANQQVLLRAAHGLGPCNPCNHAPCKGACSAGGTDLVSKGARLQALEMLGVSSFEGIFDCKASEFVEPTLEQQQEW